jgi:5-oxoprolinase (ATP-hydrolysing) subunit C
MSSVPAQAALRVLSAGPGVTLQDAGRHGYLRYGVTAAGPMDPLAHATANLAVGNPASSTAIEISSGGIELTAEAEPLVVALAGGDFAVSLDARVLPRSLSRAAMVLTIEPGAVLNIRAGQGGAWCYLAVAGRLVVPQLLGSSATHTRTGFGGVDGRAIRAGDRLSVEPSRRSTPSIGVIAAPWLDRPPAIIRVVLGPQDDYFTAPGRSRHFSTAPGASPSRPIAWPIFSTART